MIGSKVACSSTNVRLYQGRSITEGIIRFPLLILLVSPTGDEFYVYVKVFSGGQAIDRTSEVPVLLGGDRTGTIVKSIAHAGESYYWEWIYPGLTSMIMSSVTHTWDHTANFCIKGFTTGGWTPPAVPDLDCEGSLSWAKVKPGATVLGNFTVQNIGDATSELDWIITEWPDWGEWTFTPESGTDLTPEDGSITILVQVVAPSEKS